MRMILYLLVALWFALVGIDHYYADFELFLKIDLKTLPKTNQDPT